MQTKLSGKTALGRELQTVMKLRSPELQALASNQLPCMLVHIACAKPPAGASERIISSAPQIFYLPLCVLLRTIHSPGLLFYVPSKDCGADPALNLAASSIGITAESGFVPVEWIGTYYPLWSMPHVFVVRGAILSLLYMRL